MWHMLFFFVYRYSRAWRKICSRPLSIFKGDCLEADHLLALIPVVQVQVVDHQIQAQVAQTQHKEESKWHLKTLLHTQK